MGNDNTKSTTYSVRVPLWLHEELEKLRGAEETKSGITMRALVAFVAGGTDAVEG